jgi:hypothetical protein
MRRTHHSDPETARFTTQDSYLGQPDDPPSLHRFFYAANNPTRYVDLTGHDFTLNEERKYGPNEVAYPELSGTVSNADYQKFLRCPTEKGGNVVGLNRCAKQKSLRLSAPFVFDQFKLVLGFDSFCDRSEP